MHEIIFSSMVILVVGVIVGFLFYLRHINTYFEIFFRLVTRTNECLPRKMKHFSFPLSIDRNLTTKKKQKQFLFLLIQNFIDKNIVNFDFSLSELIFLLFFSLLFGFHFPFSLTGDRCTSKIQSNIHLLFLN